ncbi:MAG: hypothetical protein ACO3FB_01440 [Candidatus Nanopelagicaceae bacterium]
MRLKSLGATLLLVISGWLAPASLTSPALGLTVRSIPGNWDVTYVESSPNQGPSTITFDDTGRDVLSTFNVTFISESRQQWPEDAKKAFLRATKIWSYLFPSPVPIDVEAYWSPLEPGILGSARPGGARGGGYFQDFAGAPERKLWYPAALANAINRDKKDLDDLNPEITARFNSNSLYVSWYFGQDAKPGVRQYDFVTAVLHELGHGLGFISQETYNERLKTFSNNNPTIFSGFVTNSSDRRLSDISNTDTNFASYVTSDLFWIGENGKAANQNSPIKLFTPTEYKSGSSVSHIDDTLYPKTAPNGLMSSSIGIQQAIHDPGPIALAMLEDMRGKTPGSPLSGVQNLRGIAGNKSVTLFFDAPEQSIRQEISSYTVKIYPSNKTIITTKSPFTIDKLDPGLPYYFGVTPTSSATSGPEIKTSIIIPESVWAVSALDKSADGQYLAQGQFKGKPVVVYSSSATGDLYLSQFDGKKWNRSTVDGNSNKRGRRMNSLNGAMSLCTTGTGKNEKLQIFYTDTVEKDLLRAEYDGKKFSYETVDGNGQYIQDYRETIRVRTASNVSIANACAATPLGLQVFYRDESQGILLGATLSSKKWQYEIVDGDSLLGGRTEGDVAFHLAATAVGKKVHLIYDSVIAAPNKIVAQGDVRYATRSSTSPVDWQYNTIDLGRRESPIAGFDVALHTTGEKLMAAWLATSTASPVQADRIRWMDLNNPSSLVEEKLNVAPKAPIAISDMSVIYGCEDRLCNFDLSTRKSKLASEDSTTKTSKIAWITIKERSYALANASGKLSLLKRPDF